MSASSSSGRQARGDRFGRICRSALPERELGQAGVDGEDHLSVCGLNGQRPDDPQPLCGLRVLATANGKPRQQLLDQDVVESLRPDRLGRSNGAFAFVPAAQPVEEVARVAQQMRAEEPVEAEPPAHLDPPGGDLDRFLEPVRDVEHVHPVPVRPTQVVDVADLLGDPERLGKVVEGLVDLAVMDPILRAGVQGMTLDLPGAGRPGQFDRLVGERPRLPIAALRA